MCEGAKVENAPGSFLIQYYPTVFCLTLRGAYDYRT